MKDLIEIARECRIRCQVDNLAVNTTSPQFRETFWATRDQLQAFAKRIRNEALEEAAKNATKSWKPK
jgi:hypothetical protein